MKYFLTLSLIILIGAGCSQNTPSNETQNTNSQPDLYATENTSPTPSQDATNTSNTDTMRTLPDHEDLAAQYSKAILHTSLGDITVAFFGDLSPRTVNNFMNLAQAGEYDGTKFHRIIKDFMIQGGDLFSKDDSKEMMWGTGGPDYRFADEFNDEPLVRGSLAMANAGPNTNGSQFFIVTTAETPWLDGKHTNFGTVVDGMDVIVAIEGTQTGPNDRPLEPIVLESVELVN